MKNRATTSGLEVFHVRPPPTCVSSPYVNRARVHMRVRARPRACVFMHMHARASASALAEALALVQRAALISRSGSLAALMAAPVIRIPPRIYRYRSAILVGRARARVRSRCDLFFTIFGTKIRGETFRMNPCPQRRASFC